MSADKRHIYLVSGVCCSTEEAVLRKVLDAGLGADTYVYNPVTCELAADAGINHPRVIAQVRRAGFDARLLQDPQPHQGFFGRHKAGMVTGVALALGAAGLVVESSAPTVSIVLLLAAIITGGWSIAVKALKALRVWSLDMNVLMTAAAIGAIALGKWGEAASVIVLYSFSLMLESYSTARARKAVQSLVALSPRYASVVEDGGERVIPAEEVLPGMRIVVRPGERIPLDGVVDEGTSEVDQSAITGESSPVRKNPGDSVFAGGVNGRGILAVRVMARYENTTLARIIHLVEEAYRMRAPVQQFVDRFARVYTPTVFAVAVLVALLPPLLLHESFTVWMYRSLVLLVIACPCALVIATPVTLVSALTAAARKGILIKGGRCLEVLSEIRALAFDKTGTLTEGRPRITDIVPVNGMPRKEMLQLIAAIENRSEHPLAEAVLAEAYRDQVDYTDVRIEEFEAMPGSGVQATVNGVRYYLGSVQLAERMGFLTPAVRKTVDRLLASGKTAMVFGHEGGPLCVLGARDTLRRESQSMVRGLEDLGVSEIVMLSGDHGSVAERVSRDAGIGNHHASLLPEEKVAAVERLKRRHGAVAMVGDGINDAPALAASSVGIAMGVAGTDAALETADVVLMSDNLRHIPYVLSLSRAAMRIIRQNIVLGLGLKLVFLVLSITGHATLWMAVLADDGAALAVILNGLRLLSFDDNR